MSATKGLKLDIPFDFQPDKILETATPDQCAIVLTTGCHALHALVNTTKKLTNEEAYREAEKFMNDKLSREIRLLNNQKENDENQLKTVHADQVKQLKDEARKFERTIESLKASCDSAQIRCTVAEKQIADISASELKKIEDAKAYTRNEMSASVKKLEEALKHQETKYERADKELRAARDELGKTKLEAEKAKNDAVDKVRNELNQKNDDLQSQFRSFTARQAGSSTKGKDNEAVFAKLFDEAFSLSKDYKRKDKIGHHACDLIADWEGMKIMVENKKYAKRVPEEEVKKAIEDFESNKDCNVLMFVSEDSGIAGHERPGHLDITPTVDGRTIIWIGYFSSNGDKVVYLQMIAGFIRELATLQKSVKQLEGGEAIDSYKIRVEDLLSFFNKPIDDLDGLLKLQKKCQLEQTKTWNKLKEEMVSVIARFDNRQADVNGHNRQADVNGQKDKNDGKGLIPNQL